MANKLINDFTKHGNATKEICEAANINPWALKIMMESYIKGSPRVRAKGVKIKTHGQIITIEPEDLHQG